MPDDLKVSKKLRAHASLLASRIAIFLCFLFIVGWLISILPVYFSDLNWRMQFFLQLLERSHLPLIGFALYSLSVNLDASNRKYAPFIYWKRLKNSASAISLIYLLSLILTVITGLALIHAVYEPSISKEKQQNKIEIEIEAKVNKEELLTMFGKANFSKSEQEEIEGTENIESLKSLMKEKANRDINAHYKKLEKEGSKTINRIKLDSIKYSVMAFMYMIMYLYLYFFFNRLYKVVHPC